MNSELRTINRMIIFYLRNFLSPPPQQIPERIVQIDQARGLVSDSKNTFVKVEAGQQAYVMVVDLPSRVEGADAPGTTKLVPFGEASLTDREVMELILFGSGEEVRAALPLMTEEQKRLTLKTRSQESERP